ncbi:MAG: two-component system, OmpR family, alkaline phosphatase synthesis response regulator PhoP [Parcubacteria group bacterium Gr01-1014_29]|nr:MAG: two-component system, OmpR family, alkaline phosphatase synthesis response regulator PhoP [Parcubacteria group bacterium Gr01-1014_29]
MKKNILFIEDESALQRALGDAVRSNGYTVQQALNGDDGLRMAKSEHPDLILLDLVLPQKDGFEVLSAIHDDPELKNIPVIVLTNLESPEEVEKALSLGASTYLVKAHYSLEEVLTKIKQVIGE